MAEHMQRTQWQQFWDRGGWWRSLLLVAAYYGLYQLGSFAFLPLLQATSDPALQIVVGTALPIVLGALLLIAFAASLRWLPDVFGRQPVTGAGWMWIAVAIVLVTNVLRFATIDYGKAGASIVAAWLFAGLAIGLAEELLTRGFVVRFMRNAGYREVSVALVSALLFAAMHVGNMLSGQSLFATLLQLAYTFAFGLCMYLALRVTGSLIWPVLLHASTDPSVYLLTQYPGDSSLAKIAELGNVPVILVGIVLIFFVRGSQGDGRRLNNGATPAA
ncbi:CPBP family intramembrane metalloprotease [Leucobacter sp. UT-8R-CII-1-4]|uniref:CPBP family intramembrane glutamic endopeptidase n=1 Tax=Leucobacter sp. UT-8R-CII-1-4 TaxID=3040075 RepID=UPI0024A810B1|nr:CPBP family intramembrane glutamic endopeptidase [Leucobacter sp. UT-8R-CII-1-4]MDI6022368.1 CPBP family intramembrane metalloprotease [Leucobacter sp. UT-8R-CII-1-4]